MLFCITAQYTPQAINAMLQRVPGGVNWDSQNGPEERV